MTVLPDVLKCEEFVNADEIAKGLSPFHPEEMAIIAGKLMLKRIDYLLNNHKTFAIETTLVDFWSLYDNSSKLCPILERGKVQNVKLLNKIIESCQNKKK